MYLYIFVYKIILFNLNFNPLVPITKVKMSKDKWLNSNHPHLSIDSSEDREDIKNLVKEFISS